MEHETDNESYYESLSDTENRPETSNKTISNLVKRTNFIGQIISISTLYNRAFEPLPYTDYSEFIEKYTQDKLNVNINLLDEKKSVFMPDVPIRVKVKARRRTRRHFLNQFLYVIALTHGRYNWKVVREYSEIKEVHKALTKLVKKEIGKSCSNFEEDEIKPDWPIFPCERDHHVGDNRIADRCKKIAEYLEKCLMYPPYRDHSSMLKFLNVSPISFLNQVSQSSIEEYLHKHAYKNFYTGHFKHLKKFLCSNFHVLNQKRWFCIKDTYITYLNPYKNFSLGYTILVDSDFEFETKIKPGAYYAIQIKNSQRSLILKFKRSEQQKEWLNKIQKMIQTTGKVFKDPEYLRFGSFAPVRKSQICRWYVNAIDYMENIMQAINNAKEEIFIADWWLCPELYLKRPTYNQNHRLDSLLFKKSKQNVKIYILLYKEIDLLLCLSSEKVKRVLTQNGKNDNIKVILHPKNAPPNFTMWSHHEKFVIIDQSIAFVGGIDLCFGRWDDDEHRLVDLYDNNDQIDLKKYPFTNDSFQHDMNNKNDVMNVNKALRSIIASSALTCNLASNLHNSSESKFEDTILTFNRLSPNLVERKEESKTQRLKQKFKKLKKILNEKGNKVDPSDGFISGFSSSDDDEITPDPTIDVRFWLGKDYSNAYKEDFKDIHDFSKDQFDRNEVPRMPWRDQAMVTVGESARDLARHFIQRWNQSKVEMDSSSSDCPYLLPKSYTEPIDIPNFPWLIKNAYSCSVQMLRSLDIWSGGISQTETSILKAYCNLIEASQHYIYIENQFFVTTTNDKKDNFIKNQIGSFLVNRIVRAARENKKFRVYVVIPLLPGFENMNTILAVQYFNLRSIKFGEYSIYNELERNGVQTPSDYITFHGMRNWSVLMGKLAQEIIYVHSKLMIVDDRYVICGSANINDRSMIGKRDSEVACLVEDEELFGSVLDGRNVIVGKYAHSLRTKIFKLHLGIYFKNPKLIDVTDCVCDEFFQNFKLVSHKNTIVYDEVFKCLPSDNIVDMETLKNYSSKMCLNRSDPIKAKGLLENGIMGFIVDFPLNFLSDEKNFFPNITTPEGLVPTITWT